jgi:hypothetical protein
MAALAPALLLEPLLAAPLLLLLVEVLESLAATLDHLGEMIALRRRQQRRNLVLEVLDRDLGAVAGVATEAAQFLPRLEHQGVNLLLLVGRELQPVGEDLH